MKRNLMIAIFFILTLCSCTRSGDDSQVSSLKKQVHALEMKVQNLEQKMERFSEMSVSHYSNNTIEVTPEPLSEEEKKWIKKGPPESVSIHKP